MAAPSDMTDELLQTFSIKLQNMYSTFKEMMNTWSPKVEVDVPHTLTAFNTNGQVVKVIPQDARKEIAVKLLTTCLGLALSFGVSYYGIKWLAKALDPTMQEKKEAQERAKRLMKKIGVKDVSLSEYELVIASNLIDPVGMTVDWSQIGGLSETINEIQQTVILPFRKSHLFRNSSLLQPPKGVLLYGPPGCGKTLIAKATAKAAGARFINLEVSTLVDKWYGESQKRAAAVFSLALKLQPTIIFIDEIDSFLRSRTSTDHEATAMVKTQFMSFWDGLMTDPNCCVMIMGATNRARDVDAAILRRMPSRFHIDMPDTQQRRHILDIILKSEQLADDVDLDVLADMSEGLSGSDLRELCRMAAVSTVQEFIQEETYEDCRDEPAAAEKDEVLRPMMQKDFLTAVEKIRKSKIYTNRIFQDIDVE